MCLTLESDYAVRITGCLAACKGRLDAGRIAEETGVTLRFALKILRKLVASGLIVSFKGIGGGYELARSPSEITLLDVVAAIEGDYFINRCHEDSFECTRTNKALCTYRSIFEEISRDTRNKLSAHNFGEFT